MSVTSTSTKHPAPTDSSISLSFITSVNGPATSTIVSASVFKSAGSRSSQATFAPSGTLTPLSITAVPFKSNVLSGSIPFASTLTSSYKLSAAIITSPSLHTTVTSSQITIAPNATVSSSIENALRTSFSNFESIHSSQSEVSSGLTSSDILSGTSPSTTSVSETTPATTPHFTSSNSEARSHTTSSSSSSLTQTSTITHTPSTGSSATSDLSPHYIHSDTIQETGEDATPTITSPYTDLTPNTSGQEKHNSTPPNTGVSIQSPISGMATDTGSQSFRSMQWTSQPSDVMTSPPTPLYSQTERSKDGLTSLSPISVDLSTSAYQSGSLTALESELSTSTAFVRLRNTAQDTIYTSTFTSLKTLFTIATITASPTPTIVTTSIPYLTETEVITTTFVVHDPAHVTATTMDSASKAGGVLRLSKAQIGGIIAGAVGFFAALVAILIYFILRKRKRNLTLLLPNKKPCPECDAEMGRNGSHNFRQSIGQAPASASGSDFVVQPPSGQLRHDSRRVSSSPSTVTYQHPSCTEAVDSTNDLTIVYAQTSSSSSVDMNNHSDEGHSAESSSYLTAQTATTESLASESPDLPVDPLSRRMSQSSRMAYEKEIERLRQEVLSQAECIRYMDEQMELMQPRSPPPPSYRSSRRSAISTQTSRSSLSQPPPLPSREISH